MSEKKPSEMSLEELIDHFYLPHQSACPRCGTENVAREVFMGCWSCTCRECDAYHWNEWLDQRENN